MATYITTDTDLTSIADAIRTKGGTSTPLTYPNGFISAISEIQTGTDTADANATAADILSGKTAYVKGEKVTGDIITKGVNDLTASGKTVTVPAGYYASQTTKDVDEGYMSGWNAYIDDDSGTLVANVNFSPGYQSTSSVRITYELTTQSAQTIVPTTTDQTIAKNRYLTGVQTIKGDANLVAENIASGVSIFGVQGTHSGGNQAGYTDFILNHDTWTSYENLSISRIATGTFCGCSNLLSVNFPACTNINSYAFQSCSSLRSISFPVCTNIGGSAFLDCYSLSAANFPMCTSIGAYAFSYCNRLSTISFPNCTTINRNAFTNCGKLSSTVSFPKCTSIGYEAFWNCHDITTVSFPVCTNIGSEAFVMCYSLSVASFPMCISIGSNAFSNCSALTTANFPSCTKIGSSAFAFCTMLSTINFPVCANINDRAFWECTELQTVSFKECTQIGSAAFFRCINLKSVYLLGSSFITLINYTAFSSTPIGGYTAATGGIYGSIYVPASMLNSYKTMTNWALYSSRMVGI